ncbi:hypothetical protein PORY_002418 [Pneumocystis oryctolagi]|uniref:Uncharacterized protein n=1 Tax=Pneumocystis oryctolagi TaxID=42067 RepID=A0ACB7CAZ5_9ASCO|nr:hypothetical protein PORY_002418 [Pneumocystis oryctolagi]
MGTNVKETVKQEIEVNLSEEEKEAYEKLFHEADKENIGVLLGDHSIKFFEKTGLSPQILGEIWRISDSENMGFLTQKQFNIALRLIAHAQEGRQPNPNLINSSQIWNLVDIQRKGALNISEFAVAMHLIHLFINGSLKVLPPILLPEIFNMTIEKTYHGFPQKTVSNNLNPENSISMDSENLSNSFSQKHHKRQNTHYYPNVFSQFDTDVSDDWNIKSAEKSRYIDLFKSINKTNDNYVTGDEAVSLFLSSKLPKETLAHIWDLADIDKSGKLNKEEFIIAMHLIRQKLANINLPVSLPQDLVLSLLQKNHPQENTFFFSSPNQNSSNSIDSESYDLNNSFSPQAHMTSLSVPSSIFSVKHSNADSYIGTPKVASSNHVFSTPHSPYSHPHSIHKAPFIPTSNFGQSIMSSVTPNSKNLNHKLSSSIIDLLGDANIENSEKNEIKTNESENHSEEILSLNRQIQELKQTRTSIESDLNTINVQKHDIEEKLSQIRLLYNKEIEETQKVQEEVIESRSITQKLQQNYLILEKKIYILKNQKQQQLQNLERSKNENIELQHKIKLMNNQVFSLEKELEQLEKNILDQKNIIETNKKQLLVSENHCTQLKTSIEEGNILIHNTLKNITPGLILFSNQSSNPFHQISDLGEMDSASPILIPACHNTNIVNKMGAQKDLDKGFEKTIYDEELKNSLNITDNQYINVERDHQLLESCNSKTSSLITSPNFIDIAQKDLPLNTDLHVLKRQNSLSESLNSSVIVQPSESTPGKLSRVNSYPGTPVPWTINKTNSSKTGEESCMDSKSDNIFSKDSTIEKLELYKEISYNNLNIADNSTCFKNVPGGLLHDIELEKTIFDIDHLNTALLHSSINEENTSLSTNRNLTNVLHKSCNIEYLGIQNIIIQEENIAGTLPGTFPMDFDNQTINNKDINQTTNDKKNSENDKVNNKIENTFFDSFLPQNDNNNLSVKKNKADFDEAFVNFVSESENFSNDDQFISKFPPVKDFHSSPEPTNTKEFNSNSIVYYEDKDPVVNQSTFNSDFYNEKNSVVNEKDTINPSTTGVLKYNSEKELSEKSLLNTNDLSPNVQTLNATLQENTKEKNKNIFHDLVVAKEVNGFENDFCVQNDEFGVFFTEPFSKEMKNDWVSIDCTIESHQPNKDISSNNGSNLID